MNPVFTDIDAVNYPQVVRIYEQGIATGVATFETSAPTWNEWDKAHLPFGRISYWEGDEMLGWASLTAVSNRCIYQGVAEVSVYVDPDSKGKGVGTALLQKLIQISEEHGIWTLQASIFRENEISIALHKKCGFRVMGYRERIGKLHGKWYDNILLERRSNTIG